MTLTITFNVTQGQHIWTESVSISKMDMYHRGSSVNLSCVITHCTILIVRPACLPQMLFMVAKVSRYQNIPWISFRLNRIPRPLSPVKATLQVPYSWSDEWKAPVTHSTENCVNTTVLLLADTVSYR